ncbi:ABC transporter ATP-binding protein [Streptomyces benahoarensis]|uniref:ABC transporter ATP-binding protein n=1 Tax=Streptomyces benahoarensis TaxID=2595054 RepID=UPI002034ADCA|nr:ABC transporter ATP-binding protein [Streptomyces benahoarensis]
MSRLAAEHLTLAYDRRVIADDLSVEIPDHSFTVIVGPNGCGKSTLLRALSRMLRPTGGQVLLDGAALSSYPAKTVARTLGLLPQSSVAPDGITVADLHDLDHAARYATHLIAVQGGRVVAEGAPSQIVTAELVESVFGLRCQVIDDPQTGTPLIVPAARAARRTAVAATAAS